MERIMSKATQGASTPDLAPSDSWLWTAPLAHDAMMWFYHSRIEDEAVATEIAACHAKLWWLNVGGEACDSALQELRQRLDKAGLLTVLIEEANAFVLQDLLDVMRKCRRRQLHDMRRFESESEAMRLRLAQRG